MDNKTKQFLKSNLNRFDNKSNDLSNKINFDELKTESMIESDNNIDTSDEKDNFEQSSSGEMNEESSNDLDSSEKTTRLNKIKTYYFLFLKHYNLLFCLIKCIIPNKSFSYNVKKIFDMSPDLLRNYRKVIYINF